MTPDRSKVGFVAGDERRPDATRAECNQDIEGEIPDLVGVIALTVSDVRQNLGRLDPMPLRWRYDAAVSQQIANKREFYRRPGSPEQFVENDR